MEGFADTQRRRDAGSKTRNQGCELERVAAATSNSSRKSIRFCFLTTACCGISAQSLNGGIFPKHVDIGQSSRPTRSILSTCSDLPSTVLRIAGSHVPYSDQTEQHGRCDLLADERHLIDTDFCSQLHSGAQSKNPSYQDLLFGADHFIQILPWTTQGVRIQRWFRYEKRQQLIRRSSRVLAASRLSLAAADPITSLSPVPPVASTLKRGVLCDRTADGN